MNTTTTSSSKADNDGGGAANIAADTEESYTTNEEDQREAARLQARLQRRHQVDDNDDDNDIIASTSLQQQQQQQQQVQRLPNVSIDEGKHKYVLISAKTDTTATGGEGGERQYFVVSKRGAAYHRNAAEPFVDAMEQCGGGGYYTNIDILGGGRIHLDSSKKTIHVYGYSYGFGLADHALSKSVILQDPRYREFDVTWSNDGY